MEERNEQRKDTFFRVKEGKEHDIFISESIHDETQFFLPERVENQAGKAETVSKSRFRNQS